MAPAPLRPVPARPSGPVSDAAAVALVAATLPALGEPERTALALVALAGASRPQVALRLQVDQEQLSESLSRARKDLRRTVAALAGSGWCERSERLISDRIDGALAERDEARLDVHLRNCPRCVEHERRLVQATDALAASVGAPQIAPAPVEPQPELATVEPIAQPPVPARRPRGELATLLSWNALIVIAVILALASLALALAATLGVHF
jgi:hypothetical protein